MTPAEVFQARMEDIRAVEWATKGKTGIIFDRSFWERLWPSQRRWMKKHEMHVAIYGSRPQALFIGANMAANSGFEIFVFVKGK